MKAIMISDKVKNCNLMMNGIKTIEVRRNKTLANAIQKLIDEHGYADIYVYCSKEKNNVRHLARATINGKTVYCIGYKGNVENERYTILNGKVVFKFRCYKVEEIEACERHSPELLKQSRLNVEEFYTYLTKGKNFLGKVLGYAIHISELEIFDRPKELDEFRNWKRFDCYNADFDYTTTEYRQIRLTKAPQNFCYVEVE